VPCFEPAFAPKCLGTSLIRFRIEQNPGTWEALCKFRRKALRIVVLPEAFLKILGLTDVNLARRLGTNHVNEIHVLPKWLLR